MQYLDPQYGAQKSQGNFGGIVEDWSSGGGEIGGGVANENEAFRVDKESTEIKNYKEVSH